MALRAEYALFSRFHVSRSLHSAWFTAKLHVYLLNKQINPEVEIRKGIYMVQPNLTTTGRGKNGCPAQERRPVAQREDLAMGGSRRQWLDT